MTQHKIYLGLTDKNGFVFDEGKIRQRIINLLTHFGIDGATIYNTLGVWKGRQEESFIIEIWDADIEHLKGLCFNLKTLYNQESVCITSQKVKSTFIT